MRTRVIQIHIYSDSGDCFRCSLLSTFHTVNSVFDYGHFWKLVRKCDLSFFFANDCFYTIPTFIWKISIPTMLIGTSCVPARIFNWFINLFLCWIINTTIKNRHATKLYFIAANMEHGDHSSESFNTARIVLHKVTIAYPWPPYYSASLFLENQITCHNSSWKIVVKIVAFFSHCCWTSINGLLYFLPFPIFGQRFTHETRWWFVL